MNIPRMQQLREHLAALPPEEFDYCAFLRYTDNSRPRPEWWKLDIIPPIHTCHTTGCVAGHALMLFVPGTCMAFDAELGRRVTNYALRAQEMLDLDSEQARFLFMHASSEANLSDAVRRMDYLLAGHNTSEYDFAQESWYPEEVDTEADDE